MYTRCPSCRAEISFEPPANKDALPEDYKHRIKCPCCGVTIGVKINKSPINTAPVASNPAPQQPQPTTQMVNVYQAPAAQTQTVTSKKVSKRVAKKSGVGRNIMMMIFSLVFIGLAVVGYLIVKGVINLPEWAKWAQASTYFNGISVWELLIKDFNAFKALFSELGIAAGIVTLIPMVLFTFSGINFIVAFISAIGKKYGRAFNFIFSLLIGAAAVTCLFCPYILSGSKDLMGYLVDLVGQGHYLAIAGAGWGVLQFLFSLFFLKSLKIKDKKRK